VSETKTVPTALRRIAAEIRSESHAGWGNELSDLADILEAAPAPSDGWRPIETAPKDGEQILTYSPFGRCSVRIWGEGDDGEMAWQPRIRGYFPTHWMPLPEPPKGR